MSKVYLEDSELTNIGNAIRAKNGEKTLYLPSEMPAAIDAISGGGGGEKLPLSGNISYLCSDSSYTHPWICNNLYQLITPRPEGITDAMYAFKGMTNADYITEINCNVNSATKDFRHWFANSDLTRFPKITGKAAAYFYQYFYQCAIKTFDRTIFEDTNFLTSSISVGNYYPASTKGCYTLGMFSYCWYLEDNSDLMDYLFNDLGLKTTSIGSMYSSCYHLKKALLPIPYAKLTSKTYLSNVVSSCYSLEEIEFMEDEGTTAMDNTSYLQTWDLSSNIGWYNLASTANPTSTLQGYGFTNATRVKDEVSYQELKDSEWWWSSVPEYSKFNADSVAKLADCIPRITYGGTINFKGTSGSGYGKAISDVPDEVIAKFTEKNWTIALK